MSKEKYYITTAIAYTSRKPHIGNSYEIVLTDAIARYKRMQGYDVFFLTGTDEHGQKIEEYAKNAGVSPKEYVDKVAGEIRGICDLLNTTYDKFIRTTDDYHEKVVQKIFRKLYDQGDIYKSEYEGMYCVPCESFFTESQVVDGKCPDCGSELVPTKEEAYFLRMSKYQKQLEDYIEANPDFIYPESRKKEMVNNFIKPGIQDLCVSRSSFKWGVPVDFDDKHVIYVWIDALSNYITALGYDPDGSSELFNKYWPADAHIIGKDILRFHTIYWPIMLMALGLELPKKVFGHPWLLFGTDKMSKSKGNVIYADDLVRHFGVDAIRYYLLSEMPYAADGSITYTTIIERYNSELANTLGNLVNRTIAMSNKYFGGEILAPEAPEAVDEDLKNTVLDSVKTVDKCMDDFHVADALEAIFSAARRSNKYIDETEPWVLAKDEAQKDRLAEVLYNLTESITIGASLLHPFLPETAEKIVAQLSTSLRDFDELNQFGLYPDGTKVTDAPEILFARIDAKEIQPKVDAIQAKQKEEYEKEQKALNGGESADEAVIDMDPKEEITFDDFAKLQFQVGEVIACEAVKKSKKLLCSQVKIGSQVRQIVSGIKAYYTPEEMVGKKVMVVTNLKPAKLAGILSEGMILCAEDAEGNVCVVSPEKNMPAGSEIC